mgnify:CR=1 FL=1
MISDDLQYVLALQKVEGVGDIVAKKLINHCGSAREVFNSKSQHLKSIDGVGDVLIKNLKDKTVHEKAEQELKFIEAEKINFCYYQNENYPDRLKHCIDGPILLFSAGNIDFNNRRMISIVGTREITSYGTEFCKKLIEDLAVFNPIIVSGFAYGVDIIAHQAAMDNNLQTIGVLAHGLNQIYPKTHKKYVAKMEQNGGFLTEFWSNSNPDKENFVRRNRIVAGMCDATIVVESKVKGGSLITAELANDYNRDVFAYPGNIFDENSEGCNVLISTNKAHLIRSGADFLKKMGWDLEVKHPVQRSVFPSLTQEELHIVRLLETQGQMNIDTMAMQLNVPSSALSVLLFQLEMNGLIASVPGNRCRLV